MGRPSALTDAQWEQIGKRLLAGEKAAALAREYGVSKATISQRFSKRIETVKSVAHQLVATDEAFSKLNVSEQFAARSLADDLKAISAQLASAARFSASTAHRLAGIANGQIDKIDDADPFSDDSLKVLKGIAALSTGANIAAEIPMGLLKANKDAITELNRDKTAKPEGIPREPEYALAPDEPVPARPIL